jgi:uncharacterized membrane protein YhaH (DUF805 family)
VTESHSTRGAWLILLGSVITGAICIYDYNSIATGLQGTGGVVVVGIAAVLMFLSALTMATKPRRGRFLQSFLVIAILLDIIGSSIAGYFLESSVIMAAQALALLGWLLNVIADATDRSVETDEVEDED